MNYLGDVVPSLNIGVFWDTLFNNFPIFSKMTSYEYPIGWLMFNFDLEDSAPLKNFLEHQSLVQTWKLFEKNGSNNFLER